MTTMPQDVFISYRSTERQQVEQLVSVIQQVGEYRVWYDQEIIGGQAWWDEIMTALEHADMVVVALFNAYLQSEACCLELDYARRLGKAVLPVQIDPALDYGQLGAQLQRTQIIMFVQDQPTALKMALAAVQPGVPAADTSRPAVPISVVAELRDVVDAPGTLSPDAQKAVINALRWHLRQSPGDAPQVRELLQRLSKRPELVHQVSLEAADMMKSHGLVDAAPQGETPPRTRSRLTEPWAIIAGAVITALATIAAVIIAANLNQPPQPAPTNTMSVTQASGSTAAASTPIPAQAGAFDITLIYGSRDSFTILLNGESHLYELVLETPDLPMVISDGFDALAVTGFVGESGVCLRYIREGTQPVLPRGCNVSLTFEHPLPDADVFWFDNTINLYQNIALRQSGDLVGLCPHGGGGGRCNFSR